MNTQPVENIGVDNMIEYRINNVYGKENKYIASDHAQWISLLTRKKTVDASDMLALENLGFTFKRVF